MTASFLSIMGKLSYTSDGNIFVMGSRESLLGLASAVPMRLKTNPPRPKPQRVKPDTRPFLAG